MPHRLLLPLLLISGAASASTPTLDSAIGSLFEQKCNVCHGAAMTQGGLDLRTKAALVKGGKSGPGIVVGNSAASLVLDKVASGTMPPGDDKLSGEQT